MTVGDSVITHMVSNIEHAFGTCVSIGRGISKCLRIPYKEYRLSMSLLSIFLQEFKKEEN